MRPLRDLVLKRKLTLAILLSSCVTLLVAGALWFHNDWRSSQESQERQLTLLGEIIGAGVAPAINGGDSAAIESGLLLLAGRSSIRRASVFDAQGVPLASYAASAARKGQLPYRPEGESAEEGGISVFVPIFAGGARVGTIGIESDQSEIVERQVEFGRSALIVLCLCFLVALGMSYRLREFLSEPVLRLADTARAVSQRKDYSLRAEKLGDDELGYLTDSFNEMLEAIQERDGRLEQSRATLEEQVVLRTRQLTEKNERLQASMEEARAAAVAKSQFLANMSHEIRTPMNGILGMNELLLETTLDEQQQGYAEIVKSSAESLLEIINDILDFSKIEAGKLTLEHIEFDLQRIVQEVVELLGGTARKKGLQLAAWIRPSVPRAVRGDPTRLRQVLTNLIGNAIKFTERGKVSVRVEVEKQAEGTASVRFHIEDTGIGIAPERRGQLFQSFSQVDSSTTRRYGGTGLGLAISRQLVEMMRGEIGVTSTPDVGSTFWFTATFECLPTQRLRGFPLPEGALRPRVLVAETSAAAREMLHQQLAAWGLEHELASDAPAALDILEHDQAAGEPIGLILLDSELCASEALVDLLASPHRAVRPRVIFLTWPGAQVSGAAARCEAGATLAKPVRPSRLFDAILEVWGEGLAADPYDGSTRESELAEENGSAGELSILLAEDNSINQTVARKILARDGFLCDVVADGRAAVEALRNGSYDVVLMDCQMPELDGFEVTGLLRTHEREANKRPAHVIALTANAMKGDRERCLAAGMNDYLSKPVKPDQLLAKLRALAQSRAERKRQEHPPPPLDGEALTRRFSDRGGLLRASLAELRSGSAQLLAQLGASVRRAAQDECLPRVTDLRASLDFLGSQRLQDLLLELEALCRETRFSEAASRLQVLETELERCLPIVERALVRVLELEAPGPMPRPPAGAATATPSGAGRGSPDSPRAG